MNSKILHVLLVDDEEDHIELMRRALKDASFEMELSIARSLDEAQTFLADNTLDVVISDYRLPDGEGLALLPGDAEKRSLPIVILTGHGDETVATTALKAGAMDYIVKSDETLADIAHIIARTLREWANIERLKQGKEERMKIQSLMNQASDLVFLCDDKSHVLYVNQTAEQMAGLTPEEIIGKPLSVLFGDSCQSNVEENYAAALKGETRSFELMFKTTGILCEFKIQPYRDAKGKVSGMLGSARDIGERKKLENFWKRYSFIVT